MIDPGQFRRLVVRPTLEAMGLWSEAAGRLLVGTAIVESNLTYLTQLGGGPARGVYQIEPESMRDLGRHWLAFRPHWQDALDRFDDPRHPDAEELVTDLAFATAVARLHYYRVPQALPDPENLAGLAQYWKDHFNTVAGAGRSAGFVARIRPLWFTTAFRDIGSFPPAPALRPSSPMRVHFAAPTPPQYLAFVERYPDQVAARPQSIVFSKVRRQELFNVKRQVAVNCPYLADRPGRDVATILKDGEGGDCEDMVYTIRARLKALGWPLGALRPAICKTRAGVGHMVLCIVTRGAGVYIADNLLSHIAPWAALDHDWLARLDNRWRMIVSNRAA